MINPLNATIDDWSQYLKQLHDDDDNQKRKQDSVKIEQYYDDKQMSYLVAELKNIFNTSDSRDSVRTKRKFTMNVTKQVTDAIGVTYSQIVKRRVEGLRPKQSERVTEVLWPGINEDMANAAKLLVRQGTILIQALWDEQKQHVTYQSYPQWQFDLVYDKSKPTKQLASVIISDFKQDFAEQRSWVYTPREILSFKGAELLSADPNPLGALPFVPVYAANLGLSKDYISPPVALTERNLEINLALSNILHLLARQSHGLLTLSGFDEFQAFGHAESAATDSSPNNVANRVGMLQSGPETVLVIPGQGQLSYVQQNPDFNSQLEVIKLALSSISVSFGLPQDTFGIAIGASGGNGGATEFFVKEKRLSSLQQHFDSIWSATEKQLYKIAAKIGALESDITDKVYSASRFNIEFHPRNPMNEKISVDDLIKLYQANIIDAAEVLRSVYPSMDRTDAEEFHARMKQNTTEIE